MDHEVRFTYGVPSSSSFLDCRKNKNPKQDGHFRASTRRSGQRAVNDPGYQAAVGGDAQAIYTDENDVTFFAN